MRITDLLSARDHAAGHRHAPSRRRPDGDRRPDRVPTSARSAAPGSRAALFKREDLMTTALADGVAIPHARLPGSPARSPRSHAARRAIDWSAQDGGLTHMIFVLVVPDESGSPHLRLLAAASRLLHDVACRGRLMQAADDALLPTLRAEEERVAPSVRRRVRCAERRLTIDPAARVSMHGAARAGTRMAPLGATADRPAHCASHRTTSRSAASCWPAIRRHRERGLRRLACFLPLSSVKAPRLARRKGTQWTFCIWA
jgi:PTS system nitrogen regulatory IIA component